MKYVYPVIFTPLDEGGFDAYAPDLSFCRTCGDDLADAIEMAEDAIAMWLWDAENKNETIPTASDSIEHEPPQFINMIVADTDAYRRQMDSRIVKKTLMIPAWLNYKAEEEHVDLSNILQNALKTHLKIAD